MSDTLAAATLAAAVLAKMDMGDQDASKEATRLYRRFRKAIEKIDGEMRTTTDLSARDDGDFEGG